MRTLAIGDPVKTPSGQAGILRWTGRINGKPIEYAGVELTSGQGIHSGEHEGHKYFETTVPGSGIFVSYSKLVSANVTTPLSRLGNSRLPAVSPSKQPASRSSRAASPASPRRQPSSGDNNSEITRLKALLEERETKIKDLKTQMDLRRTEFRKHIESIEADRNQMAEHYEAMLRDYTDKAPNGTAAAQQGSEIEVQRTALAAMQNKLMEENEQMRQNLEIAQREAAEAREKLANGPTGLPTGSSTDPDLDALLKELSEQELRLAELQDAVQELDKLRAANAELEEHNKFLQERSAEMEQQLDEVVALKDSLAELTLAPEPVAPDNAPRDNAALEAAEAEIEKLKLELDRQKKRSQKLSQEAEEARKDAQMYFKMSDPDATERDKETIAKLEAEVNDLRAQLETAQSRAPITPAAGNPAAHVAGPAAKPREMSDEDARERELEDEILREAGLLGSPPRMAAPAPEPVAKVDPAAGRDMWCGLCERSGHTSLDCPYDD